MQETLEDKKDLEEVKNDFQSTLRSLKKQLKTRSKSGLIRIIFEQSIQFHELQNISKQLLEENKQLKGEQDEISKED